MHSCLLFRKCDCSVILFLVVLSISVDFVLLRWLGSWVWLLLLHVFFWIGTYTGWLGGVVAGHSLLEAITNVDGGEFASLGNGNRAWPSEGLDHIDSIRDGSFLRWGLVVQLSVSHNLGDPSSLAILTGGHLLMLFDWSEARRLNVGILLLHGLKSGLRVKFWVCWVGWRWQK